LYQSLQKMVSGLQTLLQVLTLFLNKLVENANLFFDIVYQLEDIKPITVGGQGSPLAFPLNNILTLLYYYIIFQH